MSQYHVRRTDKEITDKKELEKILKTTQYIVLALSKDNQPYCVALSHGYDQKNDCLYFHCATEGKKNDYLQANNKIWGVAILDKGYIQGKCDHAYASVHFSGKVSFIEDPTERARAFKIMINQLDRNPETQLEGLEERVENLIKAGKTKVGKISIDYMTGKKSKDIVL
jgi:hypothetical protein